MRNPRPVAALVLLLVVGPHAWSQMPESAPGLKEPILRLRPGKPFAHVTSLALGPKGKTLYAAGWDKVVRVWSLNARGKFQPHPTRHAYRVPVGPGLEGAINAMAVSSDGRWVAAAGWGATSQGPGFRKGGVIAYHLDAIQRKEENGLIYVFPTTPRGQARLLRGHQGIVESLTFVPANARGAPPLLVSVARETTNGPLRRVARLWDVSAATPAKPLLATLTTPLPTKHKKRELHERPGVAAWRTGAKPNEVRVAFSCGDGVFRIWDVAKKDLLTVKDEVFTLTAVHLPGKGQVLTGSYGGIGRSRLKSWSSIHLAKPKGDVARLRAAADTVVVALAPVSSKGNGRADRVAAVVVLPGKGNEFHLQLLDLSPGNFGRVLKDRLLWKGTSRMPVLATSLQQDFLTVAGSDTHDIRIYDVVNLLRKGELANDSDSFRHVAFVSKDKGKTRTLGLVLNDKRRKAPGGRIPGPSSTEGDIVFDFAGRRVHSKVADWKVDTPDLRGWKVQSQVEKGVPVLSVREGIKAPDRVTLPAKHTLSDYALLPPTSFSKYPLLAVAMDHFGEPKLMLYNAATGKQVRWFTGHAGKVHSVAFSADGRLLASTAEDHTVCLWSLTDLDKLLDQHGQLDGLGVVTEEKAGKKKVVVKLVEPDCPARDDLRPGDEILGLLLPEKGKTLVPVNTSTELYTKVYQLKRLLTETRGGKKKTVAHIIKVRRQRAGSTRDISFPVGQAVDERKPLMTLFFTHARKSAEQEWVGWSPLGPYEASSRKADDTFGWHFNTGDPKNPARFQAAGVLRFRYYRKGVLQELVTRAAPIAYGPRLNPRLGAWVHAGGKGLLPEKPGGVIEVPRSKARLLLMVRDCPVDLLKNITWRQDGGPPHTLKLPDSTSEPLSIPLTLRPRIRSSVKVTAWTAEQKPRPFSLIQPIVFAPSPPQIEYNAVKATSERKRLEHPRDTFQWKFQIHQGVSTEGVHLKMHHWHEGKDLLKKTEVLPAGGKWPVTRDRNVTLREGINRLEVIARNAGAPAGPGETATLTLEVLYIRKDPPVIAFQGTRSLSGKGIETSQLVTDVPEVHLRGQISGRKVLTQAVWSRGDKWKKPLTGFKPGIQKTFDIRETITVKPGENVFLFESRSTRSDQAQHQLIVNYQPQLPRVRWNPPFVFHGQKPTHAIRLVGELLPPRDSQPFRVSAVLVDGKSTPARTAFGAGKKTLVVDLSVPASRDPHLVQVRLENAWGNEHLSVAAPVRYLRPPKFQKGKVLGSGKYPRVDLEFPVQSATPLLVDSVRVKVNGRRVSPEKVSVGTLNGTLYPLRLQGVTLQARPEPDTVQVWVSNREARSRAPGVHMTERKPKLFPPPTIVFDLPEKVDQPRAPYRLTVRSSTQLTRVAIERPGKPSIPVPLARARFQGDEWVLSEGKGTLGKLQEGTNIFRVRAVNKSGMVLSPDLRVEYIPAPPRLQLDYLEAFSGGGKRVRIEPRLLPNGELAFPEALAHYKLRAVGKVLWGPGGAQRWSRDMRIKVFVNAFQQMPGQVVEPTPGAATTRFQANLLLTRKTNHVYLATERQDADRRLAFDLRCQNPLRKQRLHLLLLGMSADPTLNPKVFEKGAFVEQFSPIKLTGRNLTPRLIEDRLSIIRQKILTAGSSRSDGLDVLVIYYRGEEVLDQDDHFLVTRRTPLRGVQYERLVGQLENTPGAHVLLLDVDRKGKEVPMEKGPGRDHLPSFRQLHVAVVRYAWLGKKPAPQTARLRIAFPQGLQKGYRLEQILEEMDSFVAKHKSPSGLLIVHPEKPTDLPTGLQGLVLRRP